MAYLTMVSMSPLMAADLSGAKSGTESPRNEETERALSCSLSESQGREGYPPRVSCRSLVVRHSRGGLPGCHSERRKERMRLTSSQLARRAHCPSRHMP
jgi:hypothetical protein